MFPQMANQFRFNNIIFQLFRAKNRFASPWFFFGLVTSKLPSKTTLTRNKGLIWFDMLFSWNHLKTHHCPVMWPLCCLVVSDTGWFFFRWRVMIRFPCFYCVSVLLAVLFLAPGSSAKKEIRVCQRCRKRMHKSRRPNNFMMPSKRWQRRNFLSDSCLGGGCCRSLIQLMIICGMKICCKSRLFVSIDMFMHDDGLNHGDIIILHGCICICVIILNNEDTATKLPTRTLAAGFRLRNDPKTTKQCRFRKHYILPGCLFAPHPCRKARDAKAIRSRFWGFLFQQGLIMACFFLSKGWILIGWAPWFGACQFDVLEFSHFRTGELYDILWSSGGIQKSSSQAQTTNSPWNTRFYWLYMEKDRWCWYQPGWIDDNVYIIHMHKPLGLKMNICFYTITPFITIKIVEACWWNTLLTAGYREARGWSEEAFRGEISC